MSQSYALFIATRRSRLAFVSIFISIATTSFTVSTLSFDYDISPKKRAANPEFYGYVRSDSRMLTIFLMFFMTFFHVTIKVFACVLVAVVNPAVLLIYLAVDMASFFIFKIVRKDFIYASFGNSLPFVVISFFLRVTGRLIVEFTGSLTARHPYEITPAYWAWSQALTPVSALAAASYYDSVILEEVEGRLSSEEVEGRLSSEVVWATVGCITLAWLATWALFLRNIDRRYLHTFYSTQTASQFIIASYRAADTDERKALVFKKGFHAWRQIEGEVRTWVHANFLRWEREKPEWWAKKLIRKIPEQVLSKEEMTKLISGGLKRRKSSVFQEGGLMN